MQGLVLATAHPAKFAEVVTRAIGVAPQLPARLAAHLRLEKLSVAMGNSYEEFREFLLKH
jgi:threonine synthase